MEREKAVIGVLITLKEPTKGMKQEAASAGFYENEFGKYPKIQMVTIEELLNGKKIDIPGVDKTFKKAKKQSKKKGSQEELFR
jgi:hypothetical protein